MIKEAEKLNSITQLSSDLITVENQYKKHLIEKESISKLINFTFGEGEEIVTISRQKVSSFFMIFKISSNMLHKSI